MQSVMGSVSIALAIIMSVIMRCNALSCQPDYPEICASIGCVDIQCSRGMYTPSCKCCPKCRKDEGASCGVWDPDECAEHLECKIDRPTRGGTCKLKKQGGKCKREVEQAEKLRNKGVQDVHFPSCDNIGNYKRKQCFYPSGGAGVCNCVDPISGDKDNSRDFTNNCGEGNQSNCPSVCPTNYDRVCGSDGKTYSNDCNLRTTACRNKKSGLVKRHDGECANCPSFCPSNYDPVCGSDGKTYSNDCNLRSTACRNKKSGLVKRHDGECGKCKYCPRLLSPVCGSDGKTYDNKCLLDRNACINNKRIHWVHDGKCTGSQKKGTCGKQKPSLGQFSIFQNIHAGRPNLKCTPDGRYKNIQCFTLGGQTASCWCVNQDTGKEIFGTRKVRHGNQNIHQLKATVSCTGEHHHGKEMQHIFGSIMNNVFNSFHNFKHRHG